MINRYKIEKDGINVTVTGDFGMSGGDFEIVYQGDGGNADTCEVTLSGGQYDTGFQEPMKFTITGAWETQEVISMFKLLGKAFENDMLQ